jgi:hypothetical protein
MELFMTTKSITMRGGEFQQMTASARKLVSGVWIKRKKTKPENKQ